MQQLEHNWLPNIPSHIQPRYAGDNTKCQWWDIFQGINNWRICSVVPTSTTDYDEVEESKKYVLEGVTSRMSEIVTPNNYGSFSTDDPDADGYYIVMWVGYPYTLKEAFLCKEYDPPIWIDSGDIVCKALCMNKLQYTAHWYTISKISTVVRMAQVVCADLQLLSMSKEHSLPSGCNILGHRPISHF